MSSNEEFANDLKKGQIGEAFIRQYFGPLLKGPVLLSNPQQRIEGADIYCLQIGSTSLRLSGIEVKSFSNVSILQYGRKNIPTIPFELFSNKNSPRELWRWGWLYSITHPQEANASHPSFKNGLKVVTPGTLLYLYYEKEISSECTPFLSIAFENVPHKLMPRLKEIMASDLEYDLDTWNLPKATDPIWKKKRSVRANMWNVSLDRIADLATVTLIDTAPVISENDEDSIYKKARLTYLIQLAKDRHLDTQNERKIVADIYEKFGMHAHYIEIPHSWIENHLYNGDDEFLNDILQNDQ